MKIIMQFTLAFFLHSNMNAQQLYPTAMGSYGQSYNTGNVLLEDHIGSISVSYISAPGFMYTQGFVQPDAGTTNDPIIINDVNLDGGSTIDNAGTTLYGGSFSGGYMLEFSLGEPASTSLLNDTKILTQGVLQPYSKSKFWTGIVNDVWANASNWSPAYVPTEVDDAVIPPGCPNYPVIKIGQTAHCGSLHTMAGSSLIILTLGNVIIHK
jgi:hypothetical protein